MADSILEQIAQNVLTVVGGVTTTNGYAYQLDVARAKKINTPAHLKAYVFQLSPDDDVIDAPITQEQWKQNFAVVVYVIPTEEDSTPVDVYNNQIAAAIHKELMKDYSRGGHAINTVIKPTLYFPPVDGELAGITFMFDVIYRHSLDNPFA